MIPSIGPMIKPPTIGSKGLFCKENQPSLDFTHFHKWNATEYRHGHGSLTGEEGYWLLWVAAGEFDAQGRRVTPGVVENSLRRLYHPVLFKAYKLAMCPSGREVISLHKADSLLVFLNITES